MSTSLGHNQHDHAVVQVGRLKDAAPQKLTPSASEAHTTAYASETVVRICASAPVTFLVGISATATADHNILGSYQAECVRVPVGGRVSVYGTATVTVAEYE